jgi:hypothetical protein
MSLAPTPAVVEQTPGSEHAHSDPGDIDLTTRALDWAATNAYRFPILVDLIVDYYIEETS